MSRMFYGATAFNGDISGWKVGQVTDMFLMFNKAAKFNCDLSRWNIAKVEDMITMFDGAFAFNGNLSSWRDIRVTILEGMFYRASAFNGDLSNWAVGKVSNMEYMFHEARLFNGDVARWNVGSVTTMTSMFCATPFNGDLSRWDVGNVLGMSEMFLEADKFDGNLSTWNVGQVIDMGGMFRKAEAFSGTGISDWNVGKVTDMLSMFDGASTFNADLSRWDVGNVRLMYHMFQMAHSFNRDLSKWNVGKVTNMDRMFFDTHNFNSDLSKWQVANVIGFDHMFHWASSFNGDIAGWNVDAAENMEGMFQNARTFNSDLSGWNVGKVENMRGMFSNAKHFNVTLCGTAWMTNIKAIKDDIFNHTASGASISDTLCPCDRGPGHFVVLADCVECPRGYFFVPSTSREIIVADKAYDTFCSACPAGRWSDRPGLYNVSQCSDCPAGYFSPPTALAQSNFSRACVMCPKGRWSSRTMESIAGCDICGPGRYSDQPGRASECLACPAGRHLSEKEGLYASASRHDQLEDCEICSANTYMSEVGWSRHSCKSCDHDLFPGFFELKDDKTDAAKHNSANDCRPTWLFVAGAMLVGVAFVALVVCLCRRFRYYRRRTRQQDGELAAAHHKAVELANPLNRADFRVNPDNLTLGAEIARGGGGVIYRGTLGSAAVAVKEILANMIDAQDVAEFENEGKMVASFRHPNVLTGYGWCIKQDLGTGAKRRYIVTELATQGSLRDMLQAGVEARKSALPLPFDIVQAVRWALQIASGLRFVHGRGFMHRDVKPGNILLVDKMAKVADLGSARRDRSELATEGRKSQMRAEQEQLEQLEQQYAKEAGAAGSQDIATRMTRLQGTFYFMAPEMLNTNFYSKSIDVWSFGVMLIELLTLESPYPQEAGINSFKLAKLVSEKQLRPRKLRRADLPHPGLLNIVEGCVRFRADTRPSFAVLEEQLNGILQEMEEGQGWYHTGRVPDGEVTFN